MKIIKYLFIIKNSSFSSDMHQVGFATAVFDAKFIGVKSVEDACIIAKEQVDCGVDLIDLCSGFKKEDAQAVFNYIEKKVKISFVGDHFSENQ